MAEKIQLEFTVLRKDEQRRRVYGWFSTSRDKNGQTVIDRHGDVIEVEDLEKAAAQFVREFRQGGEDHAGGAPHDLIASIVFTRELQESMGIPAGILPEGWFGGFEIDEKAFSRLTKGELLMFSIEGEAETEMVDVEGAA